MDQELAETAESPVLEYGIELGENGCMTWSKALEEVAKLNEKLNKGEKPWRLPTAQELIDARKSNIPGFHESETSNYWSSEEFDNNMAYGVNMKHGNGFALNKSGKDYARCVR